MKEINILGFGCGGKDDITLRTLDILKNSDIVFARTMRHPSASILDEYCIRYTSFDELYESLSEFDDVYKHIAKTVIDCPEEKIAYIVPGSAVFAEKAVQLILQNAECKVNIIPAVSFLDGLFASMKTDALTSYKLLDALSLDTQKPDVRCMNIICQIYDKMTASDTKLELMKYYSDETPVLLISGASSEKEHIEKIPLYLVDRSEHIDHLTTLVVPPAGYEKSLSDFWSLTEIVRILRSKNGCDWDKAQTHQTLLPYLIEEAYEVVEAVDNEDNDNLCEELGDLLLQIILHAQIASENESFEITDVIRSISEKMLRRHPHVFETKEPTEDLNAQWERIKATEKQFETCAEKIEAIPKSFPALVYALKVQSAAAKAGFDFADAFAAFEKIYEETAELREAMDEGDLNKIKDEGGDLLFAAVNVLRFYSLSAEEALRKSAGKFSSRFTELEKAIIQDNKCIKELTEKELETYWQKAK